MKRNIKVIIISLLAIVLIWCSVIPMSAIEVIRFYGDIDNDAYVTNKHTRIAFLVAAGIYENTLYGLDFEAADIDNDDKITTKDARVILRTAAGQKNLVKLVGYEFANEPDVVADIINDYRFEENHSLVKYNLSTELCDAASLAAEEFATKTGTAYKRANGKYYFDLLDSKGIDYVFADKIVVASSANYERAVADIFADSQASKALLNSTYKNIGIGAYSTDGRTFYWCIFLTK